MTHIAFVSTMGLCPWGGSEELWSGAAMRLAQQGMSVSINVVRHAEIPRQITALEEAGCRVERRVRPQTLFQRAVKRATGDRSLQWLGAARPDFVVISQGENISGCPWMEECQRLDIPYISIAHMAFSSQWPVEEERQAMAKAYSGARTNFFVSQANLELTRRQLAHPLPNAQVVRNPFNVSYNAAPQWPRMDGTWKLACIGRMEPAAKGQDLLFDVLRQDEWRERPISVSLYGSGPNETSLRALHQSYGLKNVHFAGFTADIEKVWSEHHALVLPSRYEGLPLVVVEAMLCGRPCIVTDSGGNAELVEEGVNGFIAPAPETRSLAGAMERAWQSRDRWQSMGQMAARRVRMQVPRDPVGALLEKLMPLIPSRK